MKMLAAVLVRAAICIIAATGLYVGAVVTYAVAQEGFAAADGRRKIAPDPGDMILREKARWQAAAGAWHLAGFHGRAAVAEARAALASPGSDGAQRQFQNERVAAALALSPTAADLWVQRAEFQLMDEAPLASVIASLRMAQLTAPREVAPALARTLLVLQNWERILVLAGSPDEVDSLRGSVIQDITAARLGYAPIEINMVRAAFMQLPEDERAVFRNAFIGRMGEKLADNYIRPPAGF